MAVLSSEVWGCLVPSKERKKNFIVDFTFFTNFDRRATTDNTAR